MSKPEKLLPPIDGVVMVAHDLHCKSPEAEKKLLEWLSADYDIEDCSKDERYPRDGYYAKLKESVCRSAAKCNFCGHYNTVVASKCHGFTCAGCNKVIFREYLPKAPIRLSFKNDERMRYVNFLIHSYDDANQRLLVYAKTQPSDRWMTVKPEEMTAHLEKHKDSYEVVYQGRVKLLSFYYPTRGRDRIDEVKIVVCEVGHPPYKKIPNPEKFGGYDYVLEPQDCKQNYTEVELYKGQEIHGDSWSLPVYDHFCVYLTYKHLPEKDAYLSQKILRAAGQVSDCGYYYQDGSQAFYDIHFDWMERYIVNFTDMSADSFRKFVWHADKSGPGFICQLAAWVQEQTGVRQYVERRPNVWNAVLGIHKAMSGEHLSNGEIAATRHALDDDKTREEYLDLMNGIQGDKK